MSGLAPFRSKAVDLRHLHYIRVPAAGLNLPFPESVLDLDCPLAISFTQHICHVEPLQAQSNRFSLISFERFVAEIIPKSHAFTFCHSSPSSDIGYLLYPTLDQQLVSSL